MAVSEDKIQCFQGKTLVAFLDVCGFKGMLARGQAREALSKFYSTILRVGKDFRGEEQSEFVEVDAVAVSDCAVIFTRTGQEESVKGLRSILEFIRQVNSLLILTENSPQILTTCSIAYGDFRYENRVSAPNLKEIFFVGDAYVRAFLDNELGTPRILPGQCRLLSTGFKTWQNIPLDDPFIYLAPDDSEHWYYYWMVGRQADIEGFKSKYQKAYQNIYTELRKLLEEYVQGILP